MTPGESRTITVSREVLRLELDNLALRLTNELATKTEVAEVTARQDAFDRGELSTGLLLAIKAIVLTELANRTTAAWSLRANKAAWSVAFISVVALGVAVVSAFQS